MDKEKAENVPISPPTGEEGIMIPAARIAEPTTILPEPTPLQAPGLAQDQTPVDLTARTSVSTVGGAFLGGAVGSVGGPVGAIVGTLIGAALGGGVTIYATKHAETKRK